MARAAAWVSEVRLGRGWGMFVAGTIWDAGKEPGDCGFVSFAGPSGRLGGAVQRAEQDKQLGGLHGGCQIGTRCWPRASRTPPVSIQAHPNLRGPGTAPSSGAVRGHQAPGTTRWSAARKRCEGIRDPRRVTSRTLGGDEAEPFLDGWRSGSVWGTPGRGLENDGLRRALPTEVAVCEGVPPRARLGSPRCRDPSGYRCAGRARRD